LAAKTRGNDFYKKGKYRAAIEAYTSAIGTQNGLVRATSCLSHLGVYGQASIPTQRTTTTELLP
jgi:hypothetical protein